MKNSSTIKVFGKWILAGEYTVLRSYPALAFPLYSRFVEMDFKRDLKYGKVKIKIQEQRPVPYFASFKKDVKQVNPVIGSDDWGANKTGIKKAFSVVLNQALQKVGKTSADLSAVIYLRSLMAFGKGLGGSAVLCVLVGRLFQHIRWLKAKDLFDFCHDLESHYHGKSSGLDIAIILKEKPILFKTSPHNIQVVKPTWKPALFLSYAGGIKRPTKENIKKVQLFWKKDPEQTRHLNQQMNKAVLKALEGLMSRPMRAQDKLSSLQTALSLAENCFLKWGLIGPEMKKHIASLKKQGALAVKPTGSGFSGYVLSLWSKEPPDSLKSLLIPAF